MWRVSYLTFHLSCLRNVTQNGCQLKRVGGTSPPTQLKSQTKLKNSSEATHSVLFDTLTHVREERAVENIIQASSFKKH